MNSKRYLITCHQSDARLGNEVKLAEISLVDFRAAAKHSSQKRICAGTFGDDHFSVDDHMESSMIDPAYNSIVAWKRGSTFNPASALLLFSRM